MHRKILVGMAISAFLFAAILGTVKADPTVVVERGVELVPPGEITLRVCQTVELKWVIRNLLHPEVHYVTFTAAIEDNNLVEIISHPTYIAMYEVYDSLGNLLWEGSVEGSLSMEQFAFWDSTGVELFEMVTWRLPEEVVLPADNGYINFSFLIHCEDIGNTTIVLFLRATEDHGPQITDPKNLWLKKGRWYPLHDSYDPWDSDISSGHSFYFDWWRFPTDTAFAWASYTVIQVEGPPIPDIDVEKSGPEKAHKGDVITYTINVTNTGEDPLYGVNVTDSLLGTIATEETLAVGETKTFTKSYTVPEGAPNPLVNIVEAEGRDEFETTVTDTDTWSVVILHPDIDVVKAANATKIHYCEWVEYNVTVVNTGDCSLSVVLTDTMLGIDWSGTLAPGDKHEEIVVFHPEEDPTENTASAVGTDQLGKTVTDSASWSVDIIVPGIEVEKFGPEKAHEGDTITYTINVTNTGEDPLYGVNVTDTLLGTIATEETLAAGETKTFTKSYTVPVDGADPLVNTVTAEGEDPLGRLVTDSASWSVNILHPRIAVEKNGPDYAHEGDTITYEITVTNTGDCDLTVTVFDPMLTGELWSGPLAVGVSHTFYVNYTVPSTSDDITNTVTTTGVDQLGGPKGTVTDTASWTVDILHPDIDVEKSGPEKAHEGDTITYTINVINTGDCDLFNVTVVDALFGTIHSDSLPAGETLTFTKKYKVPVGGADPLVNTVTAEGEDMLELTVSDSASWTVDILHPSIEVTKEGPAIAYVGDTITYIINVTNTGDCPLYDVVVADPMLGTIYSDGLAIDESKIFYKDYTIPPDAPNPLLNTVTADGSDQLGKTVTDSASWSVDIIIPGIDVEKTGPTSAHQGDTITYTITVNNTGNCPLYDVTVTDTLLGDLTGYLPDNILDVGEVNTFKVTYVIPLCKTEPVVNTVTAEGTDELGLTVTDEDSWTVKIVRPPEIHIDKKAIPCIIKSGEWVTYKYVVTNTGDSVLYYITVTDDKLGEIGWIYSLDVGETVTLTKSVRLFKSIRNIGTATGEDEFGETVSDSDWAFVYVIRKCWGFATGGGWFVSEAEPTLGLRLNVGFTSTLPPEVTLNIHPKTELLKGRCYFVCVYTYEGIEYGYLTGELTDGTALGWGSYFAVLVEDHGEPGKADIFKIYLSTEPFPETIPLPGEPPLEGVLFASSTMKGGNIQIHRGGKNNQYNGESLGRFTLPAVIVEGIMSFGAYAKTATKTAAKTGKKKRTTIPS